MCILQFKTYFVPKLLHFLCPGTNFVGCNLKDALAGDKFSVATVFSLTDSLELEEDGPGDGGSNLRDNL